MKNSIDKASVMIAHALSVILVQKKPSGREKEV